MKAVLVSVILFMVGTALSSAQPKNPYLLRLSHPLSLHRAENPSVLQSRDTLRVLAIMVDFQVSSTSSVTGNGKFMLQSIPGLVDPPPHDNQYFFYKMQFIQNYFRKVSNGKLTIVGDVLDKVLTVSKQMQIYAPTAGNNNIELANFAKESWTLADSAFPGYPFAHYDAFVVFHAGVGHDLNLANLIGLDPTPSDLPTLYLGPQAFKDAFQDQSYDGIPVDSGNFKINNTIILPETDSQFFVNSLGVGDTLQVSINGIFAASIGSYLGLPDLWNTKTGREGIGQYGLEDGASFFAYFGLFPPEPCAWEKMYLGWVTPITLSSSKDSVPIPAVSLHHGGSAFVGQDTIYKIPISSSEYFLVENRTRDPFGTGQTLKIIQGGPPILKTFRSDTVGFNNNDISLIHGSVIDVQNFDWALLGYIDSTHVYDGGGIFIWHIDENVINAGLATNSVNANADRRGVYLEEAKGPQDIGQAYGTLDQGAGSEYGDPMDAWFSGNVSPTYANRFDRNSIPNSNANSGGYSLVTIKDFAPRTTRMKFSVQFGDNYLKFAQGFPKPLGVSSTKSAVQTWSNGIYVNKGDSIFVFRTDGSSGTTNANGFLTSGGGSFLPVFDATPSRTFFVGAKDSSLVLIEVSDLNGDGAYDSVSTSLLNIGHRITSPPSLNGSFILVGHADGGLIQVDPATRQITGVITGLSDSVSAILSPNCAVTRGRAEDASGRSYSFTTPFRGYAVGSGTKFFFVDTVQHSLTALNNDLTLSGEAPLGAWTGSISMPIAADLYHNGEEDAIMTIGNTIVAFNSKGFLLDGFPQKTTDSLGNASPVLLARIEADGSKDLITVSSNGLLSAFTSQGKRLSGFPIDIGTAVSGTPATFPIIAPSGSAQTGFAAMGNDGMLYAYQVSSNFVAADSGSPTPISSEFFPALRVYNWPNPVYGRTTQIRFYCQQDATVAIAIFDIAGKKITDLSGNAFAGSDAEITWDVSRVQSGVYLARVEASNQSQTQARIIKIAVVK